MYVINPQGVDNQGCLCGAPACSDYTEHKGVWDMHCQTTLGRSPLAYRPTTARNNTFTTLHVQPVLVSAVCKGPQITCSMTTLEPNYSKV